MIGIPSPGSTGKEADRAESRAKAVFDYLHKGRIPTHIISWK